MKIRALKHKFIVRTYLENMNRHFWFIVYPSGKIWGRFYSYNEIKRSFAHANDGNTGHVNGYFKLHDGNIITSDKVDCYVKA